MEQRAHGSTHCFRRVNISAALQKQQAAYTGRIRSTQHSANISRICYTVQNKQHFAGCQKIIQTLAAHFTYGNNSLRRFGIGNFFQHLVAHADELNLLGRSLFQHGAGAVILNRSIKNALHGAVTHCLFHSTQAFRQKQALLLTIFLLLQLCCSLHHWVLQSGKFHLVSPLYIVTLLFYYYTNIFKPTSISR